MDIIIKVKDGLVWAVYANGDANVSVFDFDGLEALDDDGDFWKAHDAFEKIENDPEFICVY